jgi:predicted RNase H-like HicB family nuclease
MECPDVLTEGKDLENCRAQLRDALQKWSWPADRKAKNFPLAPDESQKAAQEACSR